MEELEMTRSRSISVLLLMLTLSLVAPLAAVAQEDTFNSAGVPIHFVDMGGDGEPVVLIHSFLSSSEMWTNAAATFLLAAGLRARVRQ